MAMAIGRTCRRPRQSSPLHTRDPSLRASGIATRVGCSARHVRRISTSSTTPTPPHAARRARLPTPTGSQPRKGPQQRRPTPPGRPGEVDGPPRPSAYRLGTASLPLVVDVSRRRGLPDLAVLRYRLAVRVIGAYLATASTTSSSDRRRTTDSTRGTLKASPRSRSHCLAPPHGLSWVRGSVHPSVGSPLCLGRPASVVPLDCS